MEVVEECVRLFGWVDVYSEKARRLRENMETDTYFDIPFVRMRGVPDSLVMGIYKRAFDCSAAAFGLVLAAPLLLATALVIKLTSPGPVFYVSERIGYRGTPFRFYKFRSMRLEADRDESRRQTVQQYIRDENAGLPSKIVNTSYVTPVGRFIRKWAIDEVPQLFNVLKGDMSIVGPRPSPTEEYAFNDEWQKRRFDIKPGCTGLWKLHTSTEKGLPFSQSVLYDIYYARNVNPLLDLYIILGTIRIILAGKADG